MDWIEEKLDNWKQKMKNYSLWKALAFYLIMAVVITLAAAGFTMKICGNWKNAILEFNGITEDYHYMEDGVFCLTFEYGEHGVIFTREVKSLGASDKRLYKALGVIQVGCIPFYTVGAILLVSILYYKNKLKEPIFLMEEEMMLIRRNDLSVSCWYGSADEMGEICRIMDQMRLSMLDNQQNMWGLMEEQRKINEAFAHDLRTPLTVISGYVEMLSQYYEKGQMDEGKRTEILLAIQKQVRRLQEFSETMKAVQGFETLELKKEWHTGEELKKEICNMVEGLKTESGLHISESVKGDLSDLCYDENVIMEVLGNLLSNAIRYAQRQIIILAERLEDTLFIYVKDDGRGMTAEELYKADSPYYTDKGGGDASHLGLGLTICKILCKKHGGRMTLANSVEGGAIVCAQFFIG